MSRPSDTAITSAVKSDAHLRALTGGNPAWRIGTLLGIGAATAGVTPIIAGLRPWHILAVLALLVATSSPHTKSLGSLRVRWFDVVFGLYVLSSLIVELVNSAELRFAPDIVGVLTLLFYVAAYVAARLSIRDVTSFAGLLKGLSWPAAGVSLLGVLQVIGFQPAITFSLWLAPTEGVESRLERFSLTRAWGLTGHWTGFGAYLACIFTALICVIVIDRKVSNRLSSSTLIMLGLVSLGVVASLTLSVFATCLAVLLVTWKSLGLRVGGLLGLLGISTIGLFVFGSSIASRLDQQFAPSYTTQNLPDWVPSTLAYRWLIWERQTIPAALERMTTGWGSGVYAKDDPGRLYPETLKWLSAESQWFALTIASGIVVAIIFAVLLTIALGHFVSLRRSTAAYLAAPFAALWVTLVISSLTVPVFTNRGAPTVFWVLVGAVMALREVTGSNTKL